MKTLHAYVLHHSLRLAVYAMLAAATILCMVLVRARFTENAANRDNYDFLVRNLLLAWIPLLIALMTEGLQTFRRAFHVILPLGCVIWVVFFPNAPYLLTDFQHLRLFSDSLQQWYDVIMVIWFAFTGLFLGLVSLHVMHRLVGLRFGRMVGWAFVVAAAFLASAGIYIGRFFRFSSWEALGNPIGFGGDLWEQVLNSGSNSPGFVALYTLFLLFVYVLMHVLGSLSTDDVQAQR
jgi:uncharacterized membrane protein